MRGVFSTTWSIGNARALRSKCSVFLTPNTT